MDGLRRKNALLGRLARKEINQDEFQRECAEWVVEIIDQYHFTPLPVKPKVVEGYEALPDSVKSNLADEYFNDHPQIKEFYSKRISIKQANQSLYEWLNCCLGYINTREGKEALLKKIGEVTREELWNA